MSLLRLPVLIFFVALPLITTPETSNADCPPVGSYFAGASFEIHGTSDGSSWAWCLSGAGANVCDLNVTGPAMGASEGEIADSLVKSINEAGCAHISASSIGNTVFIQVGGVRMPAFCIGPADEVPQCCLTWDAPDSCEFGVKFLQPVFYDCFFCGDIDGNTIITISDVVYLINFIFSDGPAPPSICSADADTNGILTVSDGVYLLNWIFAGGPPPILCEF